MKRLKLKEGDKKIDCCGNCKIFEQFYGCMENLDYCPISKKVKNHGSWNPKEEGQFFDDCPLPEWDEKIPDISAVKNCLIALLDASKGWQKDILANQIAELLGIEL